VDELVVADVDPDATDRLSRIEKEEIPLGQIAPCDAHPDVGLLEGCPGEVDVEELIDLLHECGTVDPRDGGTSHR